MATMHQEKQKIKLQPKPLEKLVCPFCGELQVKIYPWSSIRQPPNFKTPPCGKCVEKAANKKK